MLVIDDSSPDGTGRARRPTRGGAHYVDVLHRERKEGLGPAYLAGFRARPGGRRRARPRDGLRLLARSERRPAAARRGRGRRGRRARLALRRGRRRSRNWGLMRRVISAGGSLYARVLLGVHGARPHRRVQVLPARACSRRSTWTRSQSKGYAFQIETTYRALRAGFTRGRGADHVRRPRGRRLEDVEGDRRRGDLEGAGAAPAALRGGSERLPGSSMFEVTDATFEQDVLQADATGRRRLLGAVVRPVPRRRPDPRAARGRARGRIDVREAEHRREPADRRRATTCSRSRPRSCSSGGEAKATLIGARPRSHYERGASGSAPSRLARTARRSSVSRTPSTVLAAADRP